MTRSFAQQVVALIVVISSCGPAAAINLYWDDEGGSADKNWSNNGNWEPDNLPDSTDDLFIGVDPGGANVALAANDVTIVDQNFTVDSITLGNGADIVNSTDGGTTTTAIQVDTSVTVGNGTGTSVITLYDAPGSSESLDTSTMSIGDGGQVTLDSDNAVGDLAILQVDNGLLDINVGGTLFGNGLIELADVPLAVTTLLDNDGTLTAGAVAAIFLSPATTLQITARSANARVDLDGSGGGNDGVVNVNRNATLDIDVPISDAFGGDMNLSAGATLDIAAGWTLAAPGTLDVNTPGVFIGGGPTAHLAGGTVTMTGGTVTLNDGLDLLTLDANFIGTGGVINNSGTIFVNGVTTIGVGVDFNMVGGDSKLTVNGTMNIDTPDFNLDGTGSVGNVTTINDGGILDLDLGAGADEDFQHTININGGELDVTTLDNNWSLTSGGDINAGGAAVSDINGEELFLSGAGTVNVAAASELNFNAATRITGTPSFVVAATGTLDFSSVTYGNSGASYTGDGILRKGAGTVTAATTMNVATVDLDDGPTTLNANLTINADSVESDVDGVDGTHTISDAAVLTVNISGGGSWTLDATGTIVYNGDAAVNTYLAGSDIAMNGTINNTGDGRTDARLDIGGTVNILTADEPFRLSGGTTLDPNTIAGGDINGPGILGADTGSSLVGFGTIDANVDFDGDSDLLADNMTLTVNGNILDARFVGTADADGTLHLTNQLNTNLIAEIRMQGGVVTGVGGIDNSGGIIRGFGRVTVYVDNGGQIIADGGTLELTNVILDGLLTDPNEGDGSASAETGSILVSYGAAGGLSSFVGTITIGAGQSFTFESGAADDLLRFDDPTGDADANGDFGKLIFMGGTLVADAVHLEGQLTVNVATSRISAGAIEFDALGANTINADLEVDGNSSVEPGATFTGGGSLLNLPGRTMTLVDGADVDVLLENNGTLVLGASAGQTQGLDFEQSATGVWNVELGGTGLNDFDRMALTGATALDGTLALSLIGGYVPVLGQTLNILSAVGGVGGTFDAVIQPVGMPAGLLFDVVYNPTLVQLMVAAQLLGDYNQNGVVDAADYVEWRDTLGDAVTAFSGADGDGDGTIDADDYVVWRAHFGQTSGSGSGAGNFPTSAVPEPASWLLATACLVACLRRSRIT